jgi:hypothetical protein
MDLRFKKENGFRIFTAVHNGNVLGYVAIDSTVGGCSCGGLRMLLENDEAETRSSARTMTKVRKTGLN